MLCLDLVQRIGDGVEDQHGGGMARFIFAHRLQELQVLEAARGRLAAFLQHGAHCLANFAQLFRRGPDDMPGNDRRGRLAQRAGFYVMGIVRHDAVFQAKVHDHSGTAQLGMRLCRRLRMLQTAHPLYVSREFQDPGIVDIVKHTRLFVKPGDDRLHCSPHVFPYIDQALSVFCKSLN